MGEGRSEERKNEREIAFVEEERKNAVVPQSEPPCSIGCSCPTK
jgi:hypothetical protein